MAQVAASLLTMSNGGQVVGRLGSCATYAAFPMGST